MAASLDHTKNHLQRLASEIGKGLDKVRGGWEEGGWGGRGVMRGEKGGWG